MLEGTRGFSRGEGEGPPSSAALLVYPSPSHRFTTAPSSIRKGEGNRADPNVYQNGI